MRPRIPVIVMALGFLSCLFGCSQQPEYQVGDFYSVNDGEGAYAVAKVLAVDEGVHIRLYKNKWTTRPETVDPSVLSLGNVNDQDGFGMGHMPLTKSAFASWHPILVGHDEVTDEELEGYQMWKDGGGGYFGKP